MPPKSKVFTGSNSSFLVSQAFVGARLDFQPALGTIELDMALNDYIPGDASLADKRSMISMEFFTSGSELEFDQYLNMDAMFDTSINSLNTTSITQSASTVTKSKAARASKHAAHKVSKKSASTKTVTSRVPGYQIMTRDGVDITDCASRGPKTKEQRERAANMRRIGACESCRKSKQRCDPSHRIASSTPGSATASTPSSAGSSDRRESLQANSSFDSGIDPPMFSTEDESLAGLELFDNSMLGMNAFETFSYPQVSYQQGNFWQHQSPSYSQSTSFASFDSNFGLDSNWSTSASLDQSLDLSPSFDWADSNSSLFHSKSQSSNSSPGQLSVDSSPALFSDSSPMSGGSFFSSTPPQSGVALFNSSSQHSATVSPAPGPSQLQAAVQTRTSATAMPVTDAVNTAAFNGIAPELHAPALRPPSARSPDASPPGASSGGWAVSSAGNRGGQARLLRESAVAVEPWAAVIPPPSEDSGLRHGIGAEVIGTLANFYDVRVPGVDINPVRDGTEALSRTRHSTTRRQAVSDRLAGIAHGLDATGGDDRTCENARTTTTGGLFDGIPHVLESRATSQQKRGRLPEGHQKSEVTEGTVVNEQDRYKDSHDVVSRSTLNSQAPSSLSSTISTEPSQNVEHGIHSIPQRNVGQGLTRENSRPDTPSRDTVSTTMETSFVTSIIANAAIGLMAYTTMGELLRFVQMMSTCDTVPKSTPSHGLSSSENQAIVVQRFGHPIRRLLSRVM